MNDAKPIDQLVAEWTDMARDLGRQHGSGHGTDDDPTDIIDLQALADLTGEGTSWSEISDISARLEEAYEDGRRG